MKKLTQLDDFEKDNERDNERDKNIDEATGVSAIKQRAGAPEKAKFRFEVSDNLKKVSRIEKTLIDTNQFLREMADEIVALKVNFPQMDPASMKAMISAVCPRDSGFLIDGKDKRAAVTLPATISLRCAYIASWSYPS